MFTIYKRTQIQKDPQRREGQREIQCQEELKITADKSETAKEKKEKSQDPTLKRGKILVLMHGGGPRSGQPAVTHSAVDSTRSIFYLWVQQNSQPASVANCVQTRAVQHAAELGAKAVGKGGLNVISRIQCGGRLTY